MTYDDLWDVSQAKHGRDRAYLGLDIHEEGLLWICEKD